MAGTSALAAPISCAGKVLSQPPSNDDAVDAPDHLLGIHGHEVSEQHACRTQKRLAQRDGGNSRGRPPACHPPRFTASATSRRWRWQEFSSLQVLQMPMTGFSMSSLLSPIPLQKARRIKVLKPSSPYDVSPPYPFHRHRVASSANH